MTHPQGDQPDQHAHGHEEADIARMLTPEYWDERYASAPAVWSGNVNPRLVEQASDLTPGTALEVGSGEGADAIWLARRGWRVLALDISTVALTKAAAHAATSGPEVAERITWQQADLATWTPSTQVDLVTAQFLHLPRPLLLDVHRQLAAAVRPGGTLLVVGHHPDDPQHAGRQHMRAMMFTAEEVAANLDPAHWDVVVAAAPERVVDPDRHPGKLRDAVLRAVRRA